MDWNALLGGATTKREDAKLKKPVIQPRTSQIQVGNVSATIVFKKVKNLRLTIRPPLGEVRISAPIRMTIAPIRAFVESKLDWIEQHQLEIRSRKCAPPIQYVTGDVIFIWGQSFRLDVIEKTGKPSVQLSSADLTLTAGPNSSLKQRESAVQSWLRDVFIEAISSLLLEWEAKMNVKAESFSVRQMRTRWGSCNTQRHTIRFNTELVKRPIECLEYVVVHELVHLLERSHNARFKGFMDVFLPDWRDVQKRLNQPLFDGMVDSFMGQGVD
jgi:predicted metal-dependent hydrolase